MKFLNALSAFFLSASFSFAANVTAIIDDDFEKGKDSPSFSSGLINEDAAALTDEPDAIVGGKSLRVSCGGDYLKNVVKFPVKNGAVYLYEFTYRIKKMPPDRTPMTVLIGDARGTPPKNCGVRLVKRIENLKLSEKEGFRVPDDGKKYFFRINVSRNSEVIVDNLKIHEIVPDKTNAYLFCENHHWHDLFVDKTFPGMYFTPTAFSFLDPYSPILDMPKEKFFPFIDKWGQYKYADWTNKIKSDSDLTAAHEREKEFYSKLRKIGNRDKYGALENSCGDFKPTGRFCLDKVDGKWILRAPNGNLFWAFGINSMGNATGSTITTNREHFFDDIKQVGALRYKGKVSNPIRGYPEDARPEWFSFQMRTLQWKYGLQNFNDFKSKMKEISDWRIKNWGITAYGAWTAPYIINENPAHPYIINTDAPKVVSALQKVILKPDDNLCKLFRVIPDVYDPRFEKIMKNGLEKIAAQIKHELCVGVFVDNEVPWEGKEGYTAEAILTCPPEQHAKIAFRDFMKERYGDVSAINKAWGANYSDWNAFLAERKFIPKTETGKKDLNDFDFRFHSHYYKMCRDNVKAISPDALYFGSRFAWRNKNAVAAAAEYCDVVSFNLYMYDISFFKMYDELKDKPLIIGEFSMSRSDYGHFWKGPQQAANGEDQTALFNHFLGGVLRHPNFVGACWFTYSDQPTTGRADGENASFGVVDICDTPHFDLIKTFRKMSDKMYKIRLGKKK